MLIRHGEIRFNSLPHRRLEELILQSFEHQKQQCLFHNKNTEHSLFQNHQCSSDVFPSKVQHRFIAHSSEIWALDWNASGTMLASGGKDCSVKVWDILGNNKFTFLGHSCPITKLRFSPNQLYLLSGSTNSHVKLWDINSNKIVLTLENHKGDVTGLEWLSNTLFCTAATNSPLCLFDISGKLIHKWAIPRITSIAKDPTNTWLSVVSGEKTIHILNINDKLQTRVFKESDAVVDVCASKYHPDLMITYHSNEIKIKNITSGKIMGKVYSNSLCSIVDMIMASMLYKEHLVEMMTVLLRLAVLMGVFMYGQG